MGVTVGTETRIEAGLDGARARTLALLAPVDDTNLIRQVSPLMSPLVWDLAHVGHYEELWLLRNTLGAAPTNELFDDVYDAFKHPRRDRPSPTYARACSTRSRRSTSRATTPCCATASCTGWSCSTSTSTTRPCSRPS